MQKRKIALGECNRKPGYETSEKQFPFHFQKPEIFDKIEAVNIVGLYQLTFRGTLRKQYHDYEVLNAELLEALRKEYKMK